MTSRLSSKCETIQKEALAHLEGETSALEKTRFHAHLDTCTECREAVSKMSDLLEAAREERFVPAPVVKDRMFDGIMNGISDTSAPGAERAPESGFGLAWLFRHRNLAVYAAAAAVVVGITVVLMQSTQRAEPSVETIPAISGDRSADNVASERLSTARLAAHLTVGATSDARWKMEETETLQTLSVEQGTLWIRYDKTMGEKPLAVKGSGLTATVIGTVLTVKAEPGRVMEVGVLSGRVAVVSNFGERQILKKGEWRQSDGEIRSIAPGNAEIGRQWVANLQLDDPPREEKEKAPPDDEPSKMETPDRADSRRAAKTKSEAADLYGLAETEMRAGNYKQAAAILEQIIRKGPKSGQADTARLDLANLYTRRLSNPAKAAGHLTAYLKRHPKGPKSRLVKRRLCRIHDVHQVAVEIDCTE
jgi:hypothetical protein